jgi:DNA-binding beta-propeller fold protein YncE
MQPVRLCLSHHNKRLFVTDGENNRILVLNRADGTLIQTFGQGKGKDPGQFNTPWGVCISPDGNELYVADKSNHRIQVFRAIDGSYVRTIGQGQLKCPRGVCVSRNGEEIYVSSSRNNGIHVLHPRDGSLLRTIGQGHLVDPDELCLSPDGQELFVADREKIAVLRVTDGGYIRSIFSVVNGYAEPELSGICLSQDGEKIYVTDGAYSHIQVLRTEDGSLIQTIGNHGETAGEFITPLGVCVSPNGELFVADTWNHRIQVFQI